MTKIVIVGEMFYSDLGIGGGPVYPPSSPGYPAHPIAPGGPAGPPSWGISIDRPSHPIAPGGPPLGIWGGAPPTYPDIGGPAPQPPSGPPLGIWGGGGVGNYPDAGFPGPQPGPGRPTHPIYYPPVIWPPEGGMPAPEHPIAPGGEERVPLVEWKSAWSPTTGWVVVGVPTVPAPTPSA
jgi:hypothetical protein